MVEGESNIVFALEVSELSCRRNVKGDRAYVAGEKILGELVDGDLGVEARTFRDETKSRGKGIGAYDVRAASDRCEERGCGICRADAVAVGTGVHEERELTASREVVKSSASGFKGQTAHYSSPSSSEDSEVMPSLAALSALSVSTLWRREEIYAPFAPERSRMKLSSGV